MLVITHDKTSVGFALDADVFELAQLPFAEVAALPTLSYEGGMWHPTGSTLGTLAAIQILQVLHDVPLGDRLDIAGAVPLGGHSDWTLRTAEWFTHSHPGDSASLGGWMIGGDES